MAESSTKNRPRQVTVGAFVVGAASLAMLLTAGSVLAKLHTVDLRQGVADFLAKGSGRSLGLGLDQALLITRVGLMVLGAVCAAMLVFAFFAARRDRSARIALSVLAVPLVVCGLLVDVFLTGFIVAATILLWTEPARDWYAGRAPRPAAQPTPPEPAPPAETRVAPLPFAGRYGEQSTRATTEPSPRSGTVRPRAVLSACLLTWGFCGLTVVFVVLAVASLGTAQVRTQFERALAQNPQARELGMTVEGLTVATAVVCGLLVLWALAAAVVALLVFQRRGWARVVLIVSAVAAGLLSLLACIAFPGFLVVALACAASVAMLIRPESLAWFRRDAPAR